MALEFIHSFILVISIAPFKSSTTQRRSRLQHRHCIGVSRRSAQATPGKGLAQGPYVTARAGVEPTTLRLKVVNSTKAPSRPTTSHSSSLPAVLTSSGPHIHWSSFPVVPTSIGPLFHRSSLPSVLTSSGPHIHSFIPAISIAPLQVLYLSEALPTTAPTLYRSFTPKRTGNSR